MKAVYICSPLGDLDEENLRKVREYTRYALKCGVAPVTPHFYALCLNGRDPKERKTAIDAGRSLLWLCDECWVFVDRITQGIDAEIHLCKILNIPVRYIQI